MRCLFLRAHEGVDKSQELLELVRAWKLEHPHASLISVELDWFKAIPTSPFAYWASEVLLRAFRVHPSFESKDRTAKHGAATLDDLRFLRCWWEVPEKSLSENNYVPFAKGGHATPFFVRIPLVINWKSDGAEVKAHVAAKVGSASRTIQAEGFYFRPGITWPLRAARFCPQVLPAGCIFSLRSSSAFVPREELARTLALLSSTVVDAILKLSLGRVGHPEFTVGVVQRHPWPETTESEGAALSSLGREAWLRARECLVGDETSHAFLLPAGINDKLGSFGRGAIECELASLQRKIDEAAYALYGVGQEERASIEVSSRGAVLDDDASVEDGEAGDEDPEEEVPIQAGTDALGSWLVGVAFGRFDPRVATRDRALPPAPEPFDPLPCRSPGMWPENEEPGERADILVDDEGHRDDLAARSHSVAERVRVDVPVNLRSWLANEFFSLHIKTYSKSRRKAPVYWQLATPSASYSVWLYIHAFSKDTLFRVLNDYVTPKLAHEDRRLESLTRGLGEGATAAQRKALAAQEAFVEELRAMLDEVKRIAPLWNPNLDDGVVINFAPLWRLVPHNKAWQKELKSTWDSLCEGKYDWAHLAMHLWPERVVPKCAKDRSLAIAHALEDVFWVEGADGKWTARNTPTRSVGELIGERTSPAVKAALRSLLEAPAAASNGSRGRAGRRRSAAGDRGDV